MDTVPTNTDFTLEAEAAQTGQPADSAQFSLNGITAPPIPYVDRIARFLVPGGLSQPGTYVASVFSLAGGVPGPSITVVIEVVQRAPDAPIRLSIIVPIG